MYNYDKLALYNYFKQYGTIQKTQIIGDIAKITFTSIDEVERAFQSGMWYYDGVSRRHNISGGGFVTVRIEKIRAASEHGTGRGSFETSGQQSAPGEELSSNRNVAISSVAEKEEIDADEVTTRTLIVQHMYNFDRLALFNYFKQYGTIQQTQIIGDIAKITFTSIDEAERAFQNGIGDGVSRRHNIRGGGFVTVRIEKIRAASEHGAGRGSFETSGDGQQSAPSEQLSSNRNVATSSLAKTYSGGNDPEEEVKQRTLVVLHMLSFHEEDITTHFGQYGTIQNFTILNEGTPKQVAKITYSAREEAQRALQGGRPNSSRDGGVSRRHDIGHDFVIVRLDVKPKWVATSGEQGSGSGLLQTSMCDHQSTPDGVLSSNSNVPTSISAKKEGGTDPEEGTKRTVIVLHIFAFTKHDIRDYFAKYGLIQNFNIFNEGTAKQIAKITYATIDEATRAFQDGNPSHDGISRKHIIREHFVIVRMEKKLNRAVSGSEQGTGSGSLEASKGDQQSTPMEALSSDRNSTPTANNPSQVQKSVTSPEEEQEITKRSIAVLRTQTYKKTDLVKYFENYGTIETVSIYCKDTPKQLFKITFQSRNEALAGFLSGEMLPDGLSTKHVVEDNFVVVRMAVELKLAGRDGYLHPWAGDTSSEQGTESSSLATSSVENQSAHDHALSSKRQDTTGDSSLSVTSRVEPQSVPDEALDSKHDAGISNTSLPATNRIEDQSTPGTSTNVASSYTTATTTIGNQSTPGPSTNVAASVVAEKEESQPEEVKTTTLIVQHMYNFDRLTLFNYFKQYGTIQQTQIIGEIAKITYTSIDEVERAYRNGLWYYDGVSRRHNVSGGFVTVRIEKIRAATCSEHGTGKGSFETSGDGQQSAPGEELSSNRNVATSSSAAQGQVPSQAQKTDVRSQVRQDKERPASTAQVPFQAQKTDVRSQEEKNRERPALYHTSLYSNPNLKT
ncbi:uncharacterized protein [Amphiura filiformis]|uniref:uncharacterized protein n=1 Tax=Amphiura filiformis TaxID=82378 RepID=UPI003B21C78D